MSSPRDYGLGSSGTPVGKPVAKVIDDPKTVAAIGAEGGCPNCRCETLMEIELEVEHPLIRGGRGTCRYIGCPACPWASPAVTTSRPPPVARS